MSSTLNYVSYFVVENCGVCSLLCFFILVYLFISYFSMIIFFHNVYIFGVLLIVFFLVCPLF